jgi:hypothetical protein
MASKQVDPEALRAYRTKVEHQLEIVENTLIPKLRNGEVLGKAPAFGYLESSQTAKQSYATFHSTTWENLQLLRQSLEGIIDTLNDSGAAHEDSDESSATDFENEL